MRRNILLTCVLLSFAILSLQGCSENDPVTGTEAPEQLSLPPANTMAMDIAFFESVSVDPQSVSKGKLSPSMVTSTNGSKLNYVNAAVRVLFLDIVVLTALAQPIAAFATAIHSVPQLQQDGSWLWTYVFVDNNIEHSIFIRGKRMESYVSWSMEVSSNDPAMPLDHFVWFAGEVENDERSGYWQFYEPEADMASGATRSEGLVASTPGVPCIRIDWQDNGSVDQRLAFLVNKPGVPEENSTLVYEEALETATIEFYDATSDETGAIIWNRDGSGSIEWPDYNNGVKSCWDSQQDDMDCQ